MGRLERDAVDMIEELAEVERTDDMPVRVGTTAFGSNCRSF